MGIVCYTAVGRVFRTAITEWFPIFFGVVKVRNSRFFWRRQSKSSDALKKIEPAVSHTRNGSAGGIRRVENFESVASLTDTEYVPVPRPRCAIQSTSQYPVQGVRNHSFHDSAGGLFSIYIYI